MTAQAKRLYLWFSRWEATIIMIEDARPEELSPESLEIEAALLALAED